ncbi:cytochrome-c peroxidase [Candidatus Palauibacter sp.]|uniref:cytochrome-c peroxidase n=1 Tax=Candidatus Palauibacter sp. TaxID=3101350 RepID=UPI003AF2CB79
MLNRTRMSFALVVAGILLGFGACGDGSVSPPDPPAPPPAPPEPPPPPPPPSPAEVRAMLIDTVRLLVDHRNLDPLEPAPGVRPELVELGRALAFDRILSGNRDLSCMTCHLPSFATGDGRSLSIGVGGSGLGPDRTHPDGEFIPRNSPALFNLHLSTQFFWDGFAEELEGGSISSEAGDQLTPEMQAVLEFGALSAQPMFPVVRRKEMRGLGDENELAALGDEDFTGVWAGLMARLGGMREYREMFEAAYPGTTFDAMTFAHAANAIAGFYVSELTFIDTPWDRFLKGDDDQLSDSALRGAKSFMTIRCMQCHDTDQFDDRNNEHHNAAIPQIGPGLGDGPGGNDDFGRERVTGDPAHRRLFKTPPMRNVELTAPYAHAGQFATLKAIVVHYDSIDSRLMEYDVSQVEPALQSTLLSNFSEILATRDTILIPITFDDAEADDLVAFLESLTDEAARDLSHLAPASVPSGLPIDK